MTDRVYLHVGVPKTGTTFVQEVLWRRRAQLARSGVCYPLRRRTEHFAATMDLRGAAWAGRRNPDWHGTWDRVAGTVRESGAATAVLSGELLAAADEKAVGRALSSFPDHEVHVVLTVRDLSRQLVSGWQEQVKHRVSVPLDDFVAGCLGEPDASERARRLGSRFWLLHDLPEVARRWGNRIPAEHLHLVTVPLPGGGRDVLWRRFAEVIGIDTAIGDVDIAHPNTSLTAPEAELLRRYNAAGGAALPPQHYDRLVRVVLAEKILAGGPHGTDEAPALALPERFAAAARARASAAVDVLASRGHDVAGDLAELVPGEVTGDPAEPASVDDDRLADTSVRAVAGLVLELGPLERRLAARQPPVSEAGGDTSSPGADRQRRAARRRDAARFGRGADRRSGPVVVHVGAPKTGTTFLQDVMWHWREPLADVGVLFARRRYEDHFRASLDLRAVSDRPGAAGVWDRVAADTRGWPGTSVISHEFFAAARPVHVDRAIDSLGRDRVHIVYTARDLWGLLGAEWQEGTKHGRHQSFGEFLTDVLDSGRDGTVGRWFWSVHDPVDVLARWARELPPERVHVLTVPQGGSDPSVLWERFAGLLRIDPSAVDTSVARPNSSLGATEVTFLRRVNAELGEGTAELVRRGEYARFVKTLLAQDVLAGRPDKARYAPPHERFEQVRAQAERFVADLGAAGYDVVGDLGEIVPVEPGTPTRHADETTAHELVEVGLDAVSGLVREGARIREAHGLGVETAAQRVGVAASEQRGRAVRLLRRAGAAVAGRGR